MSETTINFNCPHCNKSVSITLLGDGFKIEQPQRKIKKVRVVVKGEKIIELKNKKGTWVIE